MKSLNKKIFTIFLSCAMIFGGVIASNASELRESEKLETTKIGDETREKGLQFLLDNNLKTYEIEQRIKKGVKDINWVAASVVRAYIIWELCGYNLNILSALSTNFTGAGKGVEFAPVDYIDIVKNIADFKEKFKAAYKKELEKRFGENWEEVLEANVANIGKTQLGFQTFCDNLKKKKGSFEEYAITTEGQLEGIKGILIKMLENRIEEIKNNKLITIPNYIEDLNYKIECVKAVKLEDVKGLEKNIFIGSEVKDCTEGTLKRLQNSKESNKQN